MQQTPATKKFATTTNQTYQSSNRLEQATVKPEQPDGDATSPIDLTKAEEASDTIEVIIPVSAQSTTPKTEPRQESLFSPDRAVFNFRDKNGKVVRQRNLLQCETVGRLWMHATAARVIDTKQRDSLLSAVVNGGEEILLVQGDEGDFEALVEAIKRVACWTAGGVGAECKIDICAA